MMLFQCSWTTVTLISACKELMLDVFSSIGEDVMVGVGCTARRDARNSDLLKIDEIDPTYAWTLPGGLSLAHCLYEIDIDCIEIQVRCATHACRSANAPRAHRRSKAAALD
jgi:hypothetical protein